MSAARKDAGRGAGRPEQDEQVGQDERGGQESRSGQDGHQYVPGRAAAEDRIYSVDEHLDEVLSSVTPLEALELNLLDAHGCVLVEDVIATSELPPFDNSSMDGYAVRVADVAGATERYPAVLRVVGDIAAGSARLPTVEPGDCARIMTGAPVPPGTQAVVPVEWTDGATGTGVAVTSMPPGSDDPSTPKAAPRAEDAEGADVPELRVLRPVVDGAHIRRGGSDVTAGQVLLEAGTVLGPTQLGLLAALGRDSVRVRPRARVVVLSTGSELVQPGASVGPGQINDANSFLLTAAARDAGADAYQVGAVPDEAKVLLNAIADQLVRADLVITSGGVSVGAYDVVKAVFEELGEVSFRRLAMQPGKPQGYGLVGEDGTPLFALPGNPVSSYVSFELFVRPAIRTLMGLRPVHRPVVRATLLGALTSPQGKRQFLRGGYVPPQEQGGLGSVRPVGGSGSHLVGALARADSLIVLGERETEVADGAEVEVMLLDG